MKKLSCGDLQSVLAAIERLNSDVELATLPERTLEAVMSLIPNEITSFDGFGTDKNYNGYLWYSPAGTVSEERVAILGELVHGHPVYQDVVFKGIEKTTKVSNYIPLSRFQETALYHEFYKHIGGDSQMITTLIASPELYITCTLHRTQKDFSERDLTVLEILVPHLKNAFRSAQFLHRLESERISVETLMGKHRYGILTLDSHLNIHYQSLMAHQLLNEYFPPSDRLPKELENYFKYYAEVFFASEIYSPPTPLYIRKNDAKLKIHLSFQHKTQNIIVFLEEIKECSPPDLLKLGLTKRETEILYYMAKGKTDADIAEFCDISVRTVHKHREHIFIKLGVETRTAAAAKAIEVMAIH